MARRGLVLLVLFFLIPHIALAFKFHSQEGFLLVRKILLDALPHFEPHCYQMDGVCKVLDGVDLVAGKTSPPHSRPPQCRCSGCLPEQSPEIYHPLLRLKKGPSDIPQNYRFPRPARNADTI
ncbi:hypothetical protein C8R44DRAFT_923951 [Mycena epipterygia]|nr:hypothetical protein C8R44DRAFT_923951 [Mycena epipterygia]